MSSNYPPGVTGSEPQINGDSDWEKWAEKVKPGDSCLVFGFYEGVVEEFYDDYIMVRYKSGDLIRYDWEEVGPLD